MNVSQYFSVGDEFRVPQIDLKGKIIALNDDEVDIYWKYYNASASYLVKNIEGFLYEGRWEWNGSSDEL